MSSFVGILSFLLGKISVNRSWKIPQSDHFYINQENGFCQDFVDCNGFFGLRGRLQVNKSAAILIQSRQSCCNSVQSSIVKFVHNLVQSIQSKHNWGTHIGIVPKTGISWQTTWGSNPTTIAGARLTFKNGSTEATDQPKSISLHFHNPLQSRKICFTIGSDCTRILWFWTRPAFPIENVRKIINPSPINQSRLQCDYKRMSNPATIQWIGNQISGTWFFFNPERIGPIIWQSTKKVAIWLQF